eukprot:TRINITY_DN12110_c0_g2_i1.p1 TRINITY_DN12110_c0_g2~~TRINITY_DN12110_c0_g2_i1.p1  ORF type:complete len:304 (-),score=29.19 TRINITY_DN12110_c0_g2_i1:487-1323(-)
MASGYPGEQSGAPALPSLLQRRRCPAQPPLCIKSYRSDTHGLVEDVSSASEYTLGDRANFAGRSWFHAVAKSTGRKVLAKVIAKIDPDRYMQLVKELHLLQRLDHPGVVKALACCESEDNMMLICEPFEGQSLADIVAQAPEGRLTEDAAKQIFASLARAMKYLADNGVAHGRITPENVIVSADRNTAMLINFHCATHRDEFGDDIASRARSQQDDIAFAKCVHLALIGSPWNNYSGFQTPVASWGDMALSDACKQLLNLLKGSSRSIARVWDLEWLN